MTTKLVMGSVYFDSRIKFDGTAIAAVSAWSADFSLFAVAASDGSVSIYNEEVRCTSVVTMFTFGQAEVVDGLVLRKQSVATCLSWVAGAKILVIGWKNGDSSSRAVGSGV